MDYPTERYEWSGEVPNRVRALTAPVWMPNEPFEARLELVRYGRGRSSATFIWRTIDDREWPMFLVDMTEVVMTCDIRQATTDRRLWQVRKRGQNYGLALAPVA